MKICSKFLMYWHIHHVCQVSQESDKTGGVATWKSDNIQQMNHLYYKLCWLQAAAVQTINA